MVFQKRSHPFFPATSEFSDFFNEPGTIIADKTHFIPLLEEQSFQYMFLRPRRWGKSTFLNTLAAYYDVKTKDSFEEIFGGLYIGKAPTESLNSHMIILVNLSEITPIGSLEEIRRSIFLTVSESLSQFLLKYRDILGDALLEEHVIPNQTGASLKKVLVSKFGAGIYHSTKYVNRVLFTEVAIPLSLASTSMMPRPTLV